MSKLRQNIPKTILCITIFFALFPAFTKFQLFREFHDIHPITAIGIAFALGLIYLFSTLVAYPSNRRFSLSKNLAISIIAFPPLAFLLTTLTLPYLTTRIFGPQKTIQAIVTHKSIPSGGKASCKFSIAVRPHGVNHDSQQCLSQETWKIINVGDKVEIDAIVSNSGYIRKSIRVSAI